MTEASEGREIERLRYDKATIERWHAVSIREVTRLRDEVDRLAGEAARLRADNQLLVERLLELELGEAGR